jgi:hypothetical protein
VNALSRSTDFIQTIDSEIDSERQNATKEKNKKKLALIIVL